MRHLLLALTLSSTFILADSSEELTSLAKKYLGGEYLWGGETPKGFDCSGYTQYIFKKVGVNLPRTAYQQSKIGKKVKGSLKKGDLLFFNTDPSRGIPITHVGVYLENGKFIHAASRKKGIIISPLAKKYQRSYRGARRVLNTVEELNKKELHPEEMGQERRLKEINLPKDFFIINRKALVAPTQVSLAFDPFGIYRGQYMRKSKIDKLKKMENLKNKEIQKKEKRDNITKESL